MKIKIQYPVYIPGIYLVYSTYSLSEYTWYIRGIQPVPKAYRKWCVKFRTTPSVWTGFPAVIKHSLSEHLALKIKNLKQCNFGQYVFFRAQNALCCKTGGAIVGLRVSKQGGMIFSSSPTCLSLVRVNPPIPTRFWCRNQKIWGKRISSLKSTGKWKS